MLVSEISRAWGATLYFGDEIEKDFGRPHRIAVPFASSVEFSPSKRTVVRRPSSRPQKEEDLAASENSTACQSCQSVSLSGGASLAPCEGGLVNRRPHNPRACSMYAAQRA